jgi:UDP:flavonoid glycosyltransferase YjiC (YdhE family)
MVRATGRQADGLSQLRQAGGGLPVSVECFQMSDRRIRPCAKVSVRTCRDPIGRSRLDRVSNNVVVVESAPQPNLLERAAAFVAYSGLEASRKQYWLASPMVVIPFSIDQPANARRVEHHKLGHVC